jgi:DNA (cytosine-5)-methyltransferase 1
MKYLSVCSGIEAATVAWHPLGWQAVAFGEIEKFPSQVLAHHYPDTPNWGDMTKFKEWPDADVNVFVGGTPCQSFSVAGLRKGLGDPRGNLMLTYLAIAARYRPEWLVWENVPGVLSSNGGLDFASLLRGMGELGYGFAYRILDAQYFGVAQRRRRVFVVGYLGNWRPAAAVLFERHSLCGNPAPSREKREGAAAYAREGAEVGSLCARTGQSISVQDAAQGHLIPAMHSELCPSLKARDAKGPSSDGDGDGAILVPMVQPIALAENTIGRKPENGGNGDGFTEEGPMYTLNATGVHGVAQPIAFSGQMSVPQTDVDMTQTLQAKNPMAVAQPIGWSEELTASVEMAGTLQYGGQGGRHDGVMTQAMAVRRLTPKECERLQGFPDNYTDIKPKGKATPDGPRYKALGNSMAVPVMAWIGKRIQEVDAICQTQKQ